MYQGSRRKAGVEGTIPAKGNAFGDAGGYGPGDSHSQKQNADGAHSLGELYPRFRDAGAQAGGGYAPAAGHPSLMQSSIQGGAQAPKLSAPAQSIAAMLTSEHASEDAELVAGQRLAARFVRRPEDEARASSKRSVLPYVAAGAFVLLAAGGAAAYFVSSDGAGQGGNGYVSASFATPYSAEPAAEQPQAVPGQGAKSASWNEAVETFRALANSGEAPEKAAEPKLEQLATGFSTATEGK
jgi:hypothetical protein